MPEAGPTRPVAPTLTLVASQTAAQRALAQLPTWRLPWTRGRLAAGAFLAPWFFLGARELIGPERLGNPGWAVVALASALLAGLVVGSYLPSRVLGHAYPLGTSVQAVTAVFYVALAGYALAEPDPGPRHAVFAVAVLLFAVVLRTHGTRLARHAR